jgi:ABC-type transporter MlaC component
MKKVLIATLLSLSSIAFASAPAASAQKETKKVCVDVKDKEGKPVKDAKGNVKQNCKEMKVHQKLEGTPVPPAKK